MEPPCESDTPEWTYKDKPPIAKIPTRDSAKIIPPRGRSMWKPLAQPLSTTFHILCPLFCLMQIIYCILPVLEVAAVFVLLFSHFLNVS